MAAHVGSQPCTRCHTSYLPVYRHHTGELLTHQTAYAMAQLLAFAGFKSRRSPTQVCRIGVHVANRGIYTCVCARMRVLRVCVC